jgi:hypothetical protein
MKELICKATIIFLLLQTLLSCQAKQANGDNDKNIEAEVKKVVNNVLRHSSNANADSAFLYFDSSSQFKTMSMGSIYNYNKIKEIERAGFSSIKRQDWVKKTDEIMILNDSLVNYMLTLSGDVTYKNNAVEHINDYAISFLLKRMKDDWKIIFAHQSMPVAPQPSK